jgi:hypothetical protein
MILLTADLHYIIRMTTIGVVFKSVKAAAAV